jgi:hypothetical protein
LSWNMNVDEQKDWFDAKKLVFSKYATTVHSDLEWEKEHTKRRNLDRYLMRQFTLSHDNTKIDPQNIVVFCGAAKFESTGPREKYGGSPTVSIVKAIQRSFFTVLVDEYLSSQACSICENYLMEITRDKTIIRDYRYCDTCKCNVDRDYNACVNIAKAAVGWRIQDGRRVEERVKCLQNQTLHQSKQPK